MAWTAALKTFAKTSAKKVANNKLMGRGGKKGRRQNVKDIMQKQGEYEGGGALATRSTPTTSLVPTTVSDSALAVSSTPSGPSGQGVGGALLRIHTKTISIDKFLKTKKENDKRLNKKDKRIQEDDKRKKREGTLEKSKGGEEKEKKGLSLPMPSFFDSIKKFISNILLGWITLKLLEWGPKLAPILKTAGKALDGFLKIGGWLFDAIATIINIGYSAFTVVEDSVQAVFGKKGLEIFHKFTDVFKRFIMVAAIAAMFAAKAGVLSNVIQGAQWLAGTPFMKGAVGIVKKGASAVFSVSGAIVSGVGLLASAIGEGAYQLNKWGEDREMDALTKYQELSWLKPWDIIPKAGWGLGWIIMKLLNGVFGPIGVLLDIIGTPFRYLIELIRYPFLDEAGKAKQKENLAKFDSRIREAFRKVFSFLTNGVIGGGEAGSWGNIFGHHDAQAKMEEEVYNRNKEKGNEGSNEKKRLGGWISRDSTYDLHKGEIVVDGNSAVHAKDMLLAINAASTREGVIKAIKDYAPYEIGGSQPAIALPVSVTTPFMPEQNNRSLSMSNSSGGGGDNSFDILYKG